jgi:hypothetical protein
MNPDFHLDPDFISYTTPLASTPFSTSWHSSMSFAQIALLDYPIILPESALLRWKWSNTDLSTYTIDHLQHDGVVSSTDIMPILHGMYRAYYVGALSVELTYRSSSKLIVTHNLHLASVSDQLLSL